MTVILDVGQGYIIGHSFRRPTNEHNNQVWLQFDLWRQRMMDKGQEVMRKAHLSHWHWWTKDKK